MGIQPASFRSSSVRAVARTGWAILLAVFLVAGCSEDDETVEPEVSPEPVELTFPFANPASLIEIHNFALYPWNDDGEVHGGVDLVPAYADLEGTDGMRKIEIVAPADGTIARYDEGQSGAGKQSFVVVLAINTYWHVLMVFEPQSSETATNDEQRASFDVVQGQAVTRGQKIGDLVVSQVAEGSYPHVHVGVFYKNPAQTWEDLYTTLPNVSEGGAAPPILEQDLGGPTFYYCPYDYLLPAGQAALDAVPKYDMNGFECSCACSYGSVEGDCGDCP